MNSAMKPLIARRHLIATALTASSAAVIGTRAEAQERRRTFVLVHGAWHGGWCWRRVADILQAQGHKVFTPTLSGLADRSHLSETCLQISLDTHIDDIVNVFRWENITDAVLCGHSYAGMIIPGIIQRLVNQTDAVRSAVFLDAFFPGDGQSLFDLANLPIREMISNVERQGIKAVPPVPAKALRVNEHDQAWVNTLCTPQPIATFKDAARLTESLRQVPKKTYIRAIGYPSASFDDSRARLSKDPAWRVLDISCGHDAMIDMPERLSEMLVEAA